MSDVFISYSQPDKRAADALCGILEAKGLTCWIAPRDIAPGATWAAAIVDAIGECAVMLLVFSMHANASRQVAREVEIADGKRIPVIPVRLSKSEPTGDFKYFLGNRQWFDAFPEELEHYAEALFQAVRRSIPSQTKVAAAATGAGTVALPPMALGMRAAPPVALAERPVEQPPAEPSRRLLLYGSGGAIGVLGAWALVPRLWSLPNSPVEPHKAMDEGAKGAATPRAVEKPAADNKVRPTDSEPTKPPSEQASSGVAAKPEAERLLSEGGSLSRRGDFAGAIEKYDAALAMVPNNARAYEYRAYANFRLGNNEQAANDAEKSVALRPSSPTAYLNLGSAYFKLGRLEEAEVAFTKTIQINPSLAEAYEKRALVYRRSNQEARAVADEVKARELLRR